tara:strand:+ start:1833 stop:2336 length:504 start_codon:yes stop_codon:yes gene_type:complete
VFIVGKRYKRPSVPRTKKVYDEDNNTIIDTGIPNLNGVREYVQPVHNALDKTSVCKYCSKSLVRGYICRDCRDLEAPVKRTSIEERLAIEEGLKLMAKSNANRKAINRAENSCIESEDSGNCKRCKQPYNEMRYCRPIKVQAIDTAEYCKDCGMYIPTSKTTCDLGC